MSQNGKEVSRRTFLKMLLAAGPAAMLLSASEKARAVGNALSRIDRLGAGREGEMGNGVSMSEGSIALSADFINSGRGNSEDVANVGVGEVFPITIKSDNGDCNFVTFRGRYATNYDKPIMYVMVVGHGAVDWRRLERSEAVTENGNRLITWSFDRDTNPTTDDDRSVILQYGDDLGMGDSSLFFAPPYYIPGLNMSGVVVNPQSIDSSVIRTLTAPAPNTSANEY